MALVPVSGFFGTTLKNIELTGEGLCHEGFVQRFPIQYNEWYGLGCRSRIEKPEKASSTASDIGYMLKDACFDGGARNYRS